MSHWHEWVPAKVLLVRDRQLSKGSRDAVINYKRCKRCGSVLF